MAHRIEAEDTVAVRHDSRHEAGGAWHGKDKAVFGDQDPKTFWEEAGLEWSVSTHPMLIMGLRPLTETNVGVPYVTFPGGGKFEVRTTDEAKALIVNNPKHSGNVKHGKHLSTVGPDYKVVQLSHMLSMMERFCSEVGATMETAGSVRGGRVVFASCALGDSFTLPGSDKVSLFVNQSNGFIPGFAYQVDMATFRVLCNNTVMGARGEKGKGGEGEKYGRFRFIHSATWTDKHTQAALQVARDAREKFGTYKEQARLLRETHFDKEATVAYVVELLMPELHKKALENIVANNQIGCSRTIEKVDEKELGRRYLHEYISREDMHYSLSDLNRTASSVLETMWTQPGVAACKDTGWMAYNGVTYWTNHIRGRTKETREDSVMFGDSRNINEKALELAVEYCERLRN